MLGEIDTAKSKAMPYKLTKLTLAMAGLQSISRPWNSEYIELAQQAREQKQKELAFSDPLSS